MRLLKLNKYADFTSFENTWESMHELFNEALEDHMREYGAINKWYDLYPGLGAFYFWFQDMYSSSRWEATINQWSDLLENVEPELDIDFGDKFTDILAWLEDYAE